jgi:hypothetical protein
MTDLKSILSECCHLFRKGEAVTTRTIGGGVMEVTEIFAMPHVDQAAPDLRMVDVHFMKIGVDPIGAELHRDDLQAILYPHRHDLVLGPSYLAIAGMLEIEQDFAFAVMAMGEVLGIWRVITPATFGLTGEHADGAAGSGYIMISGYRTGSEVAA